MKCSEYRLPIHRTNYISIYIEYNIYNILILYYIRNMLRIAVFVFNIFFKILKFASYSLYADQMITYNAY